MLFILTAGCRFQIEHVNSCLPQVLKTELEKQNKYFQKMYLLFDGHFIETISIFSYIEDLQRNV